MSTLDRSGADLGEYPEFELSYLFDDADDPTEVTLFPGDCDEHLPTRWLSVDTAHAVPLDDAV
jgi:hypothetical protein